MISKLAGMIKESFHYYNKQDIVWFKRLFETIHTKDNFNTSLDD